MIVIIILIILFLLLFITPMEGFYAYYVPQIYAYCGKCGYKSNQQCNDCANCGMCITIDGYRECVPGDEYGPYFRKDCYYWRHREPFYYYNIFAFDNPVFPYFYPTRRIIRTKKVYYKTTIKQK